jgi:hypothetical protein
MKVSKVLMLGVATLGLATFANAGTESFTTSQGAIPNSASGTFTTTALGYSNGGLLPYFNASGECAAPCTLISATFTLGGNISQTFDVQNSNASATGSFSLSLNDRFGLTPLVAGAPTIGSNTALIPLVNGYSTQYNVNAILGEFPYPDNVGDTVTLGPGGCAFVVGNPGNTAPGASGSSACGTFVSLGNTAYTNLTATSGTLTSGALLAALTYSSGPTGYASTVVTNGFDNSGFSPELTNHTQNYSDGSVTVTYVYSTSTGTPEPVSMILFGSGLTALALIGRKRFSRS